MAQAWRPFKRFGNSETAKSAKWTNCSKVWRASWKTINNEWYYSIKYIPQYIILLWETKSTSRNSIKSDKNMTSSINSAKKMLIKHTTANK